jgi:hypothetical protein
MSFSSEPFQRTDINMKPLWPTILVALGLIFEGFSAGSLGPLWMRISIMRTIPPHDTNQTQNQGETGGGPARRWGYYLHPNMRRTKKAGRFKSSQSSTK